jgi:hypothetical protein
MYPLLLADVPLAPGCTFSADFRMVLYALGMLLLNLLDCKGAMDQWDKCLQNNLRQADYDFMYNVVSIECGGPYTYHHPEWNT